MLIGCTFTNNGAGRTGLSPTINIYDLFDDSLIVSAAVMNEIAEGGYDYDFAAYDPSKNYFWVADAGATVPNRERYRRGWTGLAGAIPDAQAGVTGGLAIVDSNNYIAGIQGTKNTLDDMTDISSAQVNAEIVDCLNVDTYDEPGQGTPSAIASLAYKIGFLYKRLINRYTETDGQGSIHNNAGDTVDHKTTISDDGTMFTKGKYESGP